MYLLRVNSVSSEVSFDTNKKTIIVPVVLVIVIIIIIIKMSKVYD